MNINTHNENTVIFQLCYICQPIHETPSALYERHGVIWASWRFKSIPTQVFVQQLIHTNSKGSIAGPSCLCAYWWIPCAKGTVMWKAFPWHDVIMRKVMNHNFEKTTGVRFCAKWQNTNGVRHQHMAILLTWLHMSTMASWITGLAFFILNLHRLFFARIIYQWSMDAPHKRVSNTKNMLSRWRYQLFWWKKEIVIFNININDSPHNDSSEIKKWLPNNSGTSYEVDSLTQYFPFHAYSSELESSYIFKRMIKHSIHILCLTHPLSREAVE